MRQFLFSALLLIFYFGGSSQNVTIPDQNFKTALLNHFPIINTNGDGEIQVSEALAFRGKMYLWGKQIYDLTGLQAFINLKELDCSSNWITNIPYQGLNALQVLDCSDNRRIHSLTISGLPSLNNLDCSNDSLSTLSLSNLPLLGAVNCSNNQFTSLDFTGIPLGRLNCDNNYLTSLIIPPTSNFFTLSCQNNYLTSIPIANIPKTYQLFCSYNPLNNLDLSQLTFLSTLECDNNGLTSLSLPNPSALRILHCSNNQLLSLPAGMTGLQELICTDNQLNSFPAAMNSLIYIDVSRNLLPAVSLNGANRLQYINISNNLCTTFSLNGKTDLEEINCDTNRLQTVSIADMAILNRLTCRTNLITDLQVSDLPLIQDLWADNNRLAFVSIMGLPKLLSLQLKDNLLNSFQLSGLPSLISLGLNNNDLSNLVISNLPALKFLDFTNNHVASLALIGVPRLQYIYCPFNLLTELDLSTAPVSNLQCNDNPGLRYLNVKNSSISNSVYFFAINSLPQLQAICADDGEIPFIKNCVRTQLPGQMVGVSSFCNFNPLGNYNLISGKVKYDKDNNGCDISDSLMRLVRVDITDGNQSGVTFTDNTGEYFYFVQSGQFTVTSGLSRSWFDPYPLSHVFNFSGTGNAAIGDFCIRASVPHPDLDIVLVTVNNAIPGRRAKYKLMYSNKGNQMASGTIQLSYDETRLNFISSLPPVNNQVPGQLVFNYSNLLPFSNRTIDLEFELEPPPAANRGETLFFNATVNPVSGDETPGDNVFNLAQVIRASFDPNDKTLLEGSSLNLEKAVNYLHYMVRFQNTGDESAVSVIINDTLNRLLDWNSFEPIAFSHPCRVVRNNNIVSFIFDGISLPPKMADEEGSQGFVAFKIKPSNSITIGDVISNRAAIYFDFNNPIITNTASTTIYRPAKMPGNGVMIYSNPSKGQVNFSVKNGEHIRKVSLFNLAGQRLNVHLVQNGESFGSIQVYNISAGIYILEVFTDSLRRIQKLVITK